MGSVTREEGRERERITTKNEQHVDMITLDKELHREEGRREGDAETQRRERKERKKKSTNEQ